MAKKLKPVHPGEILREEFMTPLGLSMNKMAMALRVPVTRIADIVNERRGITADTALRFARYFKNSAAFWMNLQTRYDLEVAEDEIARKQRRGLARRTRLPTSNPYLLTFYFVASFRPYLLTSYSLLTFPQIFRITTTRNSFKPPRLPHPFSDSSRR